MHNGVVRVKGNANSVNCSNGRRVRRRSSSRVCVILGLFFSVMTYGENGLFESVKIGLGVFLFFIAFILLLTGQSRPHIIIGALETMRILGRLHLRRRDREIWKFQIDASEITFVRPRVDKSE